METLGNRDIVKAIGTGLGDWRKLAQPLAARFRPVDRVMGAVFVAAVAKAAGDAGLEPDIRWGRGGVDVTLCTVDGVTGRRGVTAADLELAGAISDLAREQGLTAVPGEVTQVELALDTADHSALSPFWSALLTGDSGNARADEVLDPTDRVPPMWFQSTDPHEPPRQRWHLDVWLAPEVADARVEAAVAAGGTVVDASNAPSYTVLADPDGNRVCVCTALDRDGAGD
ncbi:VOC family protein [Streptomyces sp. NPDC058739]|uniref:VOC family protein n=1 Tax=Streptomyces sp. NPDC058739 TaxID=3346618 RepID=UPI0036CD64EA